MLQHILASIRYRAKMARFGIFYLRSFVLTSVRIAGKTLQLKFPDAEEADQRWELEQLLFRDVYGLKELTAGTDINTVLDIGANCGCFAIAARHNFPSARIYCYEPNQELEPSLSAHCGPLNIAFRMAAVGSVNGRIVLKQNGASMYSTSELSSTGTIIQDAFEDVVSRIGAVDLLKLDCEGAEWELLAMSEPWSNIRHLTMEYHLWARPNLTVETLTASLKRLGFSDIVIEPSANGPWGFARARRLP